MPTVIDTLITDRTQADVDTLITKLINGNNSADSRGAYNVSDLNRVGNAVAYLVPRLGAIGIEANVTPKTNWSDTDIPTNSQLVKYLNNIVDLRSRIQDYRPGRKLPSSMRHLDFEGANRIETILFLCEEVIRNVMLSYRYYSGRVTSGVNCLP